MAHSDAAGDTVFVSRFNRVLAIVIWALTALLGATTLFTGGPNRALALIPTAFVALLVWTALWRPNVRVAEDGVHLRNVLRTVTVPWTALVHVDTKYALTLYTPGRQFAAWAAPAPGRTATSMARRAESHGRVERAPSVGGTVRPGDLLATDSGQAAYLVRNRWQALAASGAIEVGIADTVHVPVRAHWWLITALVVLAVASGLALPRI